MHKLFATAALALAFLSAPALAWDIDAMNDQIEKTSVIVSGICSGTVIDIERRLVLTAHHCVTGNMREVEKTEINPETGEITKKKVMEKSPMFVEVLRRQDFEVISSVQHKAVIKTWDDKADLAIIEVIDTEWKPAMAARLANPDFKYKRGLRVYAVGNPGISYENSLTEGIISAPERAIDVGGRGNMVPYFQHSATVIGGSSGGAIYNDAGEIIGTVSAGLRGAAISFAVPVAKTHELLKRIAPKYPVSVYSGYGR